MKIYTIREMSTSDDPADKGQVLKRFRGADGWEKAKSYRDELYIKDNIKSYISVIDVIKEK
jgi:hypothetical protein